MKRRRPAHQNHLRPAALRSLGQRIAHLAARAVAQIAHRVQRLARPPRRHQHNLARHVVTPSQRPQHRIGNRIRLRHAAHAHHPARQVARARLHHAHAPLPQHLKIRLRRRMVPHIHVHRRRHQHRRRRSQIHRSQEVVGNAMRKLGQNVRRRRSHHQRLRPLRLANVLNPVLFVRRFAGPPAISSQRLVITLCPVSEANVSGCTNLQAAAVITTWTSRACRCSARTSSAALYAAIPPDTPTVTLMARL